MINVFCFFKCGTGPPIRFSYGINASTLGLQTTTNMQLQQAFLSRLASKLTQVRDTPPGWQKITIVCTYTNSYCTLKSLGEVEQARYVEAAGLSFKATSANDGRFVFIAAWQAGLKLSMARLLYPAAGIYTQEQLLSWKQLDSYN